MNDQLVEIASWRLISELFRRYPGKFNLIETHPGGGMYDCLTLFHKHRQVADFNRVGSFHVTDNPNGEPSLDIWRSMVEDDTQNVLDQVCRRLELKIPAKLPPSTPDERGLLEEVHHRFQAMDQEDIFLQVVGDGTLWVALLAVMAQLSWDEKYEQFERAVNLQRIYNCDVMRSDTSLGKLTTLVTRLNVERARELIGNEAPQIAAAIAAIENYLFDRKDQLLFEQAAREHRVGDLIWRSETGWGVVEGSVSATAMNAYLHLRGETTRVAKKNFFVNLRMAVENASILKEYLFDAGISL